MYKNNKNRKYVSRPSIKASIKGPKADMSAVVRKTLKREAEKKHWIDYGLNIGVPATYLTYPTAINLCPTIGQGVQAASRIGNEISVSKAVVKGFVNILPFNATTNTVPCPIWIKLWVVSCKYIFSNSIGVTNINTDFFENNVTNQGFQATLYDVMLPVNQESWIVHHTQMFKVGASNVSSPILGGTGIYPGYYDNSPFSANFSFDITKALGKVKYADTANVSRNKILFLVATAVSAEGLALVSPDEIHYCTKVEYTDV
jgi:hypothetical protein